MKTQLIATVVAIGLGMSAGAASASWFHWGTSKSTHTSAMHSRVKPGLSLTDAQQKLVLKDIGQSGQAQSGPTNYTPAVGATVPTALTLTPVPTDLGRQVTALKSDDYALLKRKLLIVDPTDKKVVDVINRQA